jgi:hypothetical protein
MKSSLSQKRKISLPNRLEEMENRASKPDDKVDDNKVDDDKVDDLDH